jgi:DNA invertase Pin-like site-specific DNA recombinase
MKRFVAFARMSSRGQEREGHSLDAQEAAMAAYARREGGEVVRLRKVAEMAGRPPVAGQDGDGE